MKNAIRLYGILLIGFVIMITVGIVLHNCRMNDHLDIRAINHLNGVLLRVHSERSSAFGVLRDGRKIFIFDSDNYNYNPYAVSKFLREGDSIVKDIASDTLFVYRDKNRYHFVIGKVIVKEGIQKLQI